MTRRAVTGTTYLIHFDRPYKHARHYTGWASDLDARIAAHERGDGARLLAVLKAAGITWHVARTWPGTTRATERKIKNTRNVPEYCPDCAPQRNAARRQACKNATARKEAADMRRDSDQWTVRDLRAEHDAGHADPAMVRAVLAEVGTCTDDTIITRTLIEHGFFGLQPPASRPGFWARASARILPGDRAQSVPGKTAGLLRSVAADRAAEQDANPAPATPAVSPQPAPVLSRDFEQGLRDLGAEVSHEGGLLWAEIPGTPDADKAAALAQFIATTPAGTEPDHEAGA
jgi:predicted GIY-YIG superfamily endonuclease